MPKEISEKIMRLGVVLPAPKISRLTSPSMRLRTRVREGWYPERRSASTAILDVEMVSGNGNEVHERDNPQETDATLDVHHLLNMLWWFLAERTGRWNHSCHVQHH